MNDYQPTRRELREREIAAAAQEQAPRTRRELRDAERANVFADQVAEDEFITPTGPIGILPEAKSIVVDAPPTIENLSLRLNETEVLVTGSIPLPVLPLAGTGEIKIIDTGALADEATEAERADADEVAIAPIPARTRQSGRRRQRVFATRLRAGRGQIYWVLATLLIMVTVAAALSGAWMLGLIK